MDATTSYVGCGGGGMGAKDGGGVEVFSLLKKKFFVLVFKVEVEVQRERESRRQIGVFFLHRNCAPCLCCIPNKATTTGLTTEPSTRGGQRGTSARRPWWCLKFFLVSIEREKRK